MHCQTAKAQWNIQTAVWWYITLQFKPQWCAQTLLEAVNQTGERWDQRTTAEYWAEGTNMNYYLEKIVLQTLYHPDDWDEGSHFKITLLSLLSGVLSVGVFFFGRANFIRALLYQVVPNMPKVCSIGKEKMCRTRLPCFMLLPFVFIWICFWFISSLPHHGHRAWWITLSHHDQQTMRNIYGLEYLLPHTQWRQQRVLIKLWKCAKWAPLQSVRPVKVQSLAVLFDPGLSHCPRVALHSPPGLDKRIRQEQGGRRLRHDQQPVVLNELEHLMIGFHPYYLPPWEKDSKQLKRDANWL